MKINYTITPGILLLLLLMVSSCKKVLDYIHQHPDGDLKDCRILRLTTAAPDKLGLLPDTAWFEYNAWGNPVKIRVKNIGTGNPERRFKYDKQHRLTEYIGAYSGTSGYEYWHYYTYNKKNQVVLDTAYIFITADFTGPRPTDYTFLYVTQYEYDAFGRISKATQSDPWGGSVNTYAYDAKGNLIYPNDWDVVYDNNPNIHRTNKVWMFIDRDYSVNNPYPATAFNSKGLPVKFFMDESKIGLDFLDIYNLSEAEYACK
ncbi:hypothetical protein [Foetidibacter luteolus]|uniref:hypothetical protein n=1 Tax=Foetidibacter luteolus TaxID=2608880 RepID=UPI00129A786C|nr:hypothetical protein [Foetidibacter luteolus]